MFCCVREPCVARGSELILSFAESQILYKQKFDDFVSGKGKGVIMLLSGRSPIK